MNTLNTIQTIVKIGKILAKIAFIFCCIGFGGCVAGLISAAVGMETLHFGGVSIEGLLQENAGVSTGTLYATMAAGAFICAGGAVVSKFTQRYCEHELEAGTPFCESGAKELLRLGIITITVPLGAQVAAQIVYAVLQKLLENVADFEMELSGTVALGIMFIIVSLLCRYGAQIAAQNHSDSCTR